MVDVIHGSYEEKFPEVVGYLASAYRQPVPTFAFIDLRGYADNPFSHVADFKCAMPSKSEVMVYLPASFMARFLETGITDEALTKLYGGPTWEDAKAMGEHSRQRVGQRLVGLFGDRLKEHFDWVTSFNVEPERHNDYYLLFGTDHEDGLRAMKQGHVEGRRAQWEGLQAAPKSYPTKAQLFSDDALITPPDTSILGALLKAEFPDRSIHDYRSEDETSRFAARAIQDKPHLRQLGAAPLGAERQDQRSSSHRGPEKATTRPVRPDALHAIDQRRARRCFGLPACHPRCRPVEGRARRALVVRPPHCLKKNATSSCLAAVAQIATHSASIRRCRGPGLAAGDQPVDAVEVEPVKRPEQRLGAR